MASSPFRRRRHVLGLTILACLTTFVESGFKYLAPSWGGCKQGGDWHRPGDKPATTAGFHACRNQCQSQGYSYFGGECPMGVSRFHCQCANSANRRRRGLGNAKPIDGGTCLRNVGHCTGPFIIFDSANCVSYYLGAHGYGSVYSVTQHSAAACPTKKPTKKPTKHPTKYPVFFSFVSFYL